MIKGMHLSFKLDTKICSEAFQRSKILFRNTLKAIQGEPFSIFLKTQVLSPLKKVDIKGHLKFSVKRFKIIFITCDRNILVSTVNCLGRCFIRNILYWDFLLILSFA